MEEIKSRLDAQAGQLRALAETVTALISTLPIDRAVMAGAQIETARLVALEEDEVKGTSQAESAARDATMKAYAQLVLRVVQPHG